ncbi:MAG: mechanosensitive ion channel family protein [Candidatus Methanomethylophilus sp.]|jgi:small-conductance mechanosensitive channel|nr:mechanosensitive ion channel family protein [Methanomethylophilus sp.]MCI2075521.1 mechanosensitive ion channel family protein [Methanomethylophilus sp.]MCI2093343.1 mechanosensitive ion channel family protein [Methanomethylophilus sp.]
MFRSRNKLLIAAAAVLAMLAVAIVPVQYSDDSSAAINGDLDGVTDIAYICEQDSITVSANGTTQASLLLINNNTTDAHYISVSASTDNSKVSASAHFSGSNPENTKTLSAKVSGSTSTANSDTAYIEISADRYAHQGDYTLTVFITSYDSTGSGTPETGSVSIDLKVTSDLSSGNKYNKFLGFIENDFSGIMGEVWFTAIVSFFGLLAIGYVIMLIAVPICVRIVMKKDDPDREYMKKTLYDLCHVIIILWAIGQVLRIAGTGEEYIDIVNRVFYVCYLIVGAIVGWRLYKLVVDVIITRIGNKDDRHRKDYDSLRPLFMYIGEIAIATVVTIVALSMFGVDVAAIITSAGLISLGISMGAKDVLSQFFSGLVILATRPFQKGDLIQVGTDTTVYRVREVNIMNTQLENWDNTDINIMPNSTLETSRIKNITGETTVYKCYISMSVSYDSDLNKVRQIMQDVASANPHVITDGSYGRPYTRVEEFEDSNIQVKMGMYVDDFNTSYTVRGQIRQALYAAFKENGIDIDYTRIVVEDGGKAFPNEGADGSGPSPAGSA